MRSLRTFALLAAVAAPWIVLPRDARADEIATCVKASEAAQSLRDDGKYRKAREQLLVCSRDACPGVVRKDCLQWLSEVDQNMPSLVITARDAEGHDLVDVKVTMDGAPLTDRLDGKPIAVDPGEHTLRYEAFGPHASAGAPPVEERVVMHVGERNRQLAVRIGAPPAAPAAAPAAPPAGDAAPRESSGAPIAAYVIGGVGVLAIGSFAFFGITGKNDVDDMRSPATGCAPTCDPSRVDSARAKLLVADVSLGVGVVALGVATYMFLTHKSEAVSTGRGAAPPHVAMTVTDVAVGAVPGGGVAQLGGRF